MKFGLITVDDPFDLSRQGAIVSFSSKLTPSSSVAAEALASQLAGYSPGSVVAVMDEASGALPGGFYRVAAIRTQPAGRRFKTTGRMLADVDLVPMPDRSSIRVETLPIAVERDTGTHAVSSLTRLPISLESSSRSRDDSAFSATVLAGSTLGFYPSLVPVTYVMPLHSFHVADCVIEAQWNDGVWRPVIGRTLPPDITPDRLRIANQRMRWRVTGAGAVNAAELNSTATGYDAEESAVTSMTFSAAFSAASPRVVINTAAVVVVEYRAANAGDTISVRLQRGDRYLTITTNAAAGADIDFATTAGSSGTGYQEFGDYVFACETAFTVSGVNADSTGGSPARSFMVGKSSSGTETASVLTRMWWRGLSVRDRFS